MNIRGGLPDMNNRYAASKAESVKKLGETRFARFLLSLGGFGALVWFLIRVIPKPIRATYPCMKAAAPLAANFVLSVLAFFASITFFKKFRKFLYDRRWIIISVILAVIIGVVLINIIPKPKPGNYALTSLDDLEGPNKPMGTGVGINPGRVVWVHEPDATNEDYTMRGAEQWYTSAMTNQAAVDAMFSKGLQELTGTTNDYDAWDLLFRNFKEVRGLKGEGYKKGEKIVIKINMNGMGLGPFGINTSPQLCRSLLNHLVNLVGVDPKDIHIGDPNITMDKTMYGILFSEFPDVNYWGRGAGYVTPKASAGNVIFASDGGNSDPLPQSYLDATYMFNLSVLKKHHRAGVSMAAKNHFGSITPFNRNGAFDWHYGLPVPEGGADNSNGSYGVYRVLVDFMGHEDLGGKTILYVVDGLWSSINWGHWTIKWRMSPFNDDYPSSLFFSQDPVAIESVGFDFLYNEFDQNHPTEGQYDPRDNSGPFPHYRGVDDYLHQAADSANRPAGLIYDPEKDGTPLPASLGTHEHWNNAEDKQYSRNLGKNTGIELVRVEDPWN